MTNVLRRFLVAAATIAFVAGALMLSGGATRAQGYLQEGINNVGGEVVKGGEVIGQDPDIHVRLNIVRQRDSRDY